MARMEEMIDVIQDMLRQSEAKVEREREKVEQMAEQNKAMEMLLEQVKELSMEVEKHSKKAALLNVENEQLTIRLEKSENMVAQLKKEREEQRTELVELKMQLAELNKMANKVVEKTEHEELQRVLRAYINKSKCKKQEKREYIKTVIMELVQTSGMTLPDDMQTLWDSLDDEVEKKVTQVTVEAGGMNIQNAEKVEK